MFADLLVQYRCQSWPAQNRVRNKSREKRNHKTEAYLSSKIVQTSPLCQVPVVMISMVAAGKRQAVARLMVPCSREGQEDGEESRDETHGDK